MKTIVLLADTVRRDFLSIYGNNQVKTPNLERLQKKSVVFDQHWAGSLPCMPARHDMMTGRINFLERNWGPIEPFDDTLPQILNRNHVFSHICTDHYHYFEIGAENYCQCFNTWELIRGQENDPWISQLHEPETPDHIGQLTKQYNLNRSKFVQENDFTSPKTIQASVEWLEENKDADNYLLWVEMFDPHEPFDLPSEYLDLYDDDYSGPLYMWPHYRPVDVPSEALKHLRNRYAGLITMMDRWLGKLFDIMDKQNMWDDTMVIFTTDHGFMLGEHNFIAKNYMPMFNEITHLPLLVHFPGGECAGKRIDAITQNIDILPTVLDLFGINPNDCRNSIHGKSWLPLIRGEADKLRDYAIYGYYGKNVNITDGKYTYFRAAVKEDNSPLNIYTSIPTSFMHFYGHEYLEDFMRIDMGRFLKWTDFPVYKIPADNIRVKDKSIAFNQRGEFTGQHLLFNLESDYQQNFPIKDPNFEKKYEELLANAMRDYEAPDEQFTRMGL